MPESWEHFLHLVVGRVRRHEKLPDLRHLPSRRVALERTHFVVNDPERRHLRSRLYVLRHEAARRRSTIAVFSNGRRVGYLPERIAKAMAPLLDLLGGAAVVNGAGAGGGSIRLRVDVPTHEAMAEFARSHGEQSTDAAAAGDAE